MTEAQDNPLMAWVDRLMALMDELPGDGSSPEVWSDYVGRADALKGHPEYEHFRAHIGKYAPDLIRSFDVWDQSSRQLASEARDRE